MKGMLNAVRKTLTALLVVILALPLVACQPDPPVRAPVWIDPGIIAGLPMTGTAWDTMLAQADANIGTANIANQDSRHDINTLAVALVAARTGDPAYRQKAEDALLAVIGTEANADPDCDYTPSRARSMSLGRNLLSYVVAADVINLRADEDPLSPGSVFSAWVDEVRYGENCPNTGSGVYPSGTWNNLSEEHDNSGSNGSAMAGASRIAAAAYLGDRAELDAAWDTFLRYSGDRNVGPDLYFNANGLTWSHDNTEPVAVNPLGSTKDGHSIDGAIIADIGRGGAFTWPPGWTQYQWEGTAAFVAQARLLDRAGYPAFSVSDNAPLRAVMFSRAMADEFGDDPWWDHSDWVKYLINWHYGLSLPINGPADEGKNMAWTDWMFGS